jgi:hypothetical protein
MKKEYADAYYDDEKGPRIIFRNPRGDATEYFHDRLELELRMERLEEYGWEVFPDPNAQKLHWALRRDITWRERFDSWLAGLRLKLGGRI